MLTVHLPDGSQKQYDRSVTPKQIAAEIGPGLAKAALAAQVDGKTVGVDFPLPADGDVKLRLLTKKDPEALDVMRHSCAHVMARAVMRLWPGVQLAFGPTVEGGFYYDFELPHALSEEDFPKIEAEMKKIVALNEPFERLEEPRDKARQICADLAQTLKVEHIETGLAEHPTLSFYRQGEFIDLCRGPHVPSAGAIGAFKLLNVAGAYWKGDASRQQLQRLYATAFFDQKDLDAHLQQIEEAKRRDHRALGKQHQLFSVDARVGQGLVLWQPKGAIVRGLLENFVREELKRRQYLPVYSPNIGRVELYQTSGHFPYYRESQFAPLFEHQAGQLVDTLTQALQDAMKTGASRFSRADEEKLLAAAGVLGAELRGYNFDAAPAEKIAVLEGWAGKQERFLLKPMNCPHHVMIYQSVPRSYRELPLRLAEFGTVYRYEKSGQLNGMTRVRGFTQDDAHIFCTDEQVEEEFRSCIDMTKYVLKCLGLDNYRVRLGFRDPDSSKYVGSAEQWDQAQTSLVQVCRNLGMDFSQEAGEAAFYGPKADFVVTDCLGREWQLGTVQLDYNLPSETRFALEYVAPDNKAHRPVMIHRAPLGSLERFIGVLIEHFAGAFPLWLAPEQVRVMSVGQNFEAYARQIEQRLVAAGFRVTGDYRPERINAKIRNAQLDLVPYMFVVGGKEMESGSVSVRDRILGDVGVLKIEEAIQKLTDEVAARTVRQSFQGRAAQRETTAENDY